jgi:hypothetical protein
MHPHLLLCINHKLLDIEHDVDLAANLLEDDYSLTSEIVNRRVIIHTLSVYNEFVSTGIVPK